MELESLLDQARLLAGLSEAPAIVVALAAAVFECLTAVLLLVVVEALQAHATRTRFQRLQAFDICRKFRNWMNSREKLNEWRENFFQTLPCLRCGCVGCCLAIGLAVVLLVVPTTCGCACASGLGLVVVTASASCVRPRKIIAAKHRNWVTLVIRFILNVITDNCALITANNNWILYFLCQSCLTSFLKNIKYIFRRTRCVCVSVCVCAYETLLSEAFSLNCAYEVLNTN